MRDEGKTENFKETMRSWATGVAIVTGHYEGQSHGMTANSFNSIALSPPTVMVALRHNTRTESLVRRSGHFAISIMESSQVHLARRFAGQVESEKPRFEGVDTFTLVTGAPLITAGLAHLDCKTVNVLEFGGSSVFIGEVLAAQKDAHGNQPLLYFNRQWRKLAEECLIY